MDTVISLTSIPPRFSLLGQTLDSLVAQCPPGAEIRLYLPRRYARFPDWDGRLPTLPPGVRLCRCDTDYGPASKVLPAAAALRGRPARVLFCDDDRVYPPGWASALLATHDARPDTCVALLGRPLRAVIGTGWRSPHRPEADLRKRLLDPSYRFARLRQQIAARRLRAVRQKPPRRIVRRAGHADIFWGYGGVVVPAGALPDAAWQVPEVARTVDDIWLSGMLALAGVPIWLPDGHYRPAPTAADPVAALRNLASDRLPDRDTANRACIRHLQETFGIWR